MPTAAKLVAAILWGALAWFSSELTKPLFPEGTDLGFYSEINALIGVVMGWQVAGKRAGGSWSGAISYGLTATFAVVFWCLFLHSFAEMVRLSIRKLYDGPVDALVGVFALMTEYGQLVAAPNVIATVLIGGLLAGIITEWTARKYS